LAAVLENDLSCIHTGHKLTRLSQATSHANAEFSNGAQAEGAALIGCDGIHSVVREILFGKQDPKFTGYIAWRGLVPTARLPKNIIRPDSAICTGPDQTFTRYAIRGGELLNYVAIAKRSGWEVESWSVRSEISEILQEFADWSEDVRQMIAATPADSLYKWALFDRDPLDNWTVGRITLLGDAAHAMLPFLGQGAAMAIEDGLILGRAFAKAANVPEALQRYQNARQKRTEFVLLESRENIKRLQRADTAGYNQKTHKNEEILGLFDYNPITAAI
jgi:salicylate hydroxylase